MEMDSAAYAQHGNDRAYFYCRKMRWECPDLSHTIRLTRLSMFDSRSIFFHTDRPDQSLTLTYKLYCICLTVRTDRLYVT